MLLDLREKVRSSKPIKYTLITLISIPFVLFGIGSYFSGGAYPTVAEINGQEIDQRQLDRAYQQQRQQMAQMFGGQLPEAFDNDSMLRQQALQQLVTQQVLEGEVVEQNFAVGDETLGRAIRNMPGFQVEGRFDSEAYQNALRSSGMSVPMFEQSFRDDTAINQFRSGISSTSFILPQEAQRLAELGRQTRTIEAVSFSFADASEAIEVSEEDVTAYFDENKDNYQFPERAKIQYIELNSDDIAEQIEISDEEAEQYYEDNRASYMLSEQREASHILLDLEDSDAQDNIAALNELKERIAGGESFEDLAGELSDDVGSAELGGSLGVIAPGAMVPEFEQAVFALTEPGELSEPVTTEFGVHLIRLDSITPESGKPFDEVRDEIISTMQQNQADSEYFELREQLVEQSFDNPDSLEPASDATGLEILTSDWLDSETDSGEVLSHPQVQSAMFSDEVLQEEVNSELIDVSDRHVVVLRVTEHEGPRPKSLDDVREEVTETLKGERATEQLAELVDSALETLAAGESASSAAEGESLATVHEQVVIDRQSNLFDRGVVSRIFSLPQPDGETVTERVTLASGDQMALRLDTVAIPDPANDEEPQADEPPIPVAGVDEAGFSPRLGGTEFQALMESLRNEADVEIMDVASP